MCPLCDKGHSAGPWTKCNGCSATAHQKCVSSSWNVRWGPWLCAQCHVCFECEDPVEEDCLCCSVCYIAFHWKCVLPGEEPKTGAEEQRWRCRHCLAQGAQQPKVKEENGADDVEAEVVVKRRTAAGRSSRKGGKGSRKGRASALGVGTAARVVDPKVPDASKWSAKEVRDFFAGTFPTEAEVFQEQEIDGVSLLLMRRTDVIQGLGLKLGPALRIYKKIVMLQTRDTDPTLTWF